jgi:eukaryotic-like serine/threonine-protein kinase
MKEIGLTLLKIIGLTVLLIVVFNFMLRFFTRHDDHLSVPKVQGMSLETGIRVLEGSDMGYILTDSLFDPALKPGTIVDQSPKEGAEVKAGRKIYLTINSTNPPTVKMPNLVDMSKRQAILVLESWGLKSGKEIYQPDIAKDAVLGMRFKGRDISEGALIPKGSTVDIILGDGLGLVDVDIPDLTGLTVMEAISVLDAVHLTVGELIRQGEIEDELSAYVYMQQPEFGSQEKVSPGDPVNLYITKEIPQNLMRR